MTSRHNSTPPHTLFARADVSPDLIRGYHLNYRIGRGGMGVVYHATQQSLDRPVAVKVLTGQWSNDPEMVTRFEREAGALGRLNHPNIVSVIERGSADGIYYYVMEFIDGRSLNDVLREKLILSRDEFAKMVHQISSAIQYIHANGIIHRDIKPGNILRDAHGDFRLSDFGLIHVVRPTSSSSSQSGGSSVVGTPMYLAPEQLHSHEKITPATDVYAFAVICYELLTGMLPLGRFKMPSEVNPTLVPAVDEPIRIALSRDSAERFQSVTEFEAAILASMEQAPNLRLRPCKRTIEADHSDFKTGGFSSSSHVSARGSRPGVALYPGYQSENVARRNRITFYAIVGVLLMLVAISAVVFWPEDARPDPAVVVETPTSAGNDTDAVRWAETFADAKQLASSDGKSVLFVVFTEPGGTADSIEIGPGTLEKLHQVAVPLVANPLQERDLHNRLAPPGYPYVFVMSADGTRVFRESSWPVIGMNVADFIELGVESAEAFGRWETDLTTARARAIAQQKKMFIIAGCGEDPLMINELKMDIGVDPMVGPMLDDYILLSVESEAGCDEMINEGFISFPIIAVWDPAEDTYTNQDRLSADVLFKLPEFLRDR